PRAACAGGYGAATTGDDAGSRGGEGERDAPRSGGGAIRRGSGGWAHARGDEGRRGAGIRAAGGTRRRSGAGGPPGDAASRRGRRLVGGLRVESPGAPAGRRGSGGRGAGRGPP